MKRLLLTPLLFALLVAFTWADDAVAPAAKRNSDFFQHNRRLIHTLIDSGIQLAREQDPLRRAEVCTGVATQFADEIDKSDEDRATDLSRHAHKLISGSVQINLSEARIRIPAGSAEERKLKEITEKADAVRQRLRPLPVMLDEP